MLGAAWKGMRETTVVTALAAPAAAIAGVLTTNGFWQALLRSLYYCCYLAICVLCLSFAVSLVRVRLLDHWLVCVAGCSNDTPTFQLVRCAEFGAMGRCETSICTRSLSPCTRWVGCNRIPAHRRLAHCVRLHGRST